jgi:predicted NAD/FAD-binding protein
MSFSVKCDKSGLEYNGTSLNTLFAQRCNLIRPAFYRMLRDILRFNRAAPALLNGNSSSLTLGEYLTENGYSAEFLEYYIIPMGAAIWSADPCQMRSFPARYFVQFFHNHGMLSLNQRPQGRVITGGSKRYIEALTRPYQDCLRLNCPVVSITRHPEGVKVQPRFGGAEPFDRVVIATHSDQALAMLTDPTPAEREILSAFPYQKNEAILHTDSSILPRRRRAWASWNYHILRKEQDRVALTYNMNILQSIRAPQQFCVTLNRTDAIDPAKIIRRLTYHHPVYTHDAVAAQKRYYEINGINRTYFCGAYWGYGFHEDGVKSALAVGKDWGKSW